MKYARFVVVAQIGCTLLSAGARIDNSSRDDGRAGPGNGCRPGRGRPASADYVLGPDDVISIKALNADEIRSDAVRIDPSGQISLPLMGRLTAAGLTVEASGERLSASL